VLCVPSARHLFGTASLASSALSASAELLVNCNRRVTMSRWWRWWWSLYVVRCTNVKCVCAMINQKKQAVRGRPAPYPRPSPPPWASKRLAPPSRPQHSSSLTRPTCLTPTAAAAWRTNTAVSKATWWLWPLTFWSWKWCLSHVWHGLPLCQFWSS